MSKTLYSQANHALQRRDSPENSPQASRPKVLVVDDDATVRLLAREHLETAGFEVHDLADGNTVVETTLRIRPDAIILDVLLPDIDGFTIAEALRALPDGRHTPILMLTRLDDEESIERAFACGATEFTIKPVNWTNEVYRNKSK